MTRESIFNPIMENLKALTKDLCFITGSRAWGIENHLSDFDVVILEVNRDDVMPYLGDLGEIETSSYNNGFKVLYRGCLINIIPTSMLDFLVWYKSTRMIKDMYRGVGQVHSAWRHDNKTERVGCFEAIRGIVKVHLGITEDHVGLDILRLLIKVGEEKSE